MKGRNEDEDVVDPLIAKYEPPKTIGDKIHAFIYGNPPRPFMERAKEWASGQNAMLAVYLVLVVLVGTGNRVTFKLMQFALVNYSYFVSQLTTFIYVPVSFAIIFFKMLFTNHITPEMTEFPKYKFAVMGLLDSLQGLLITVGGNYVPGIMQNLLMQGVVPVTMLTSLLILRPRGCQRCKKLLTLVKASKRSFQQESTLPEDCTESKCLARLVADHREIFGWDKVDEKDAAETSDFLQRSRILEANNVLVLSSARPWKTHLSIFYSPTQYLGAAVIIAGLVVSVWPALVDSGGGAFQWDVVFFSATIPTALSSVYKEIAFREVADMDVWYLNGWVALYQFYFGLFYAPLAAVMNQPAIAIVDIPQNLWHGFLCFLLGNNYITENCDSSSSCGLKTTCCDSCDGSLSDVSRLRALYGVLLYMTFNLTYNILLVLVIKYGSAALMYVASTIVLPLGAVGFMISAFMGSHATPFDKYNGAGLAVVLCGLIIYRFFAFKKTDVPYQLGDDYEHFNLDGTTTTTTGPSNNRTYVLTSPVDSKNAAK